MTQALYRKWRPHTWEQVFGQEHIIQTLRNAVASERVAHALLFAGPRGTGKTTTARILAKAVNCLAPDLAARPCDDCDHCTAVNQGRFLDLIEIDAASNTSVEDVRDLRDKINFSPNQGRYKVYVIDECFRYEDLITLANGSKLPIGKIVEENLNVDVLSFNPLTNKLEPKPVVRHMCKRPESIMVRIVFNNNRVLFCTINHKFYTPKGQIHAGELEVGQFVYANYESITQHQLSVIAGAALGDGHLSLTDSKMRARLSITQGVDQLEYLDYKLQLLGDLVESPAVFSNYPKTFTKKGVYRSCTISRPQIAQLHRDLYHNSRKIITPSLLEKISPLGLAIWYLDDGSLVTSPNPYAHKRDSGISYYPSSRSTLATHGFTVEEVKLVVGWLKNKWDIEGGFSNTAKGPVIWLTLAGTVRLHEIIAAFVPPSMDYKLLPEFRGKFSPPSDDGTPGGLAVSIVKSIERVPATEFVYNIEVADNHNYFVRDILVSNCHMLSTAAFNALLKTLEEPPSHALFVLATTEIHKIPATILSRCQRHEFRRIPVADIVRQLQILCAGENIQVEPEALTLIARQSAGGMRDAISLLDQLASTGQMITLGLAQTVLGAATGQAVLDLIEALLGQDSAAGLDHIHAALDAGTDPRQFARQIVEYLRQLLLVQMGNAAQVDATAEARAVMARHTAALPAASLLRVIKAFNQAAADARLAWQPALPLEMAFVESLGRDDQAHPQDGAPTAEGTAASDTPTPRALRQSVKLSPSRSVKSAPVEVPEPAQDAPEQVLYQMSATPEPAPPADDPLYKRLTESWRQIVASVKQRNANTAGLLNSIRSRDLRGNVLTLGFASDVLKSQMEKPVNIEIFQGVLQQALGVEIVIRCITAAGQRSVPPPDVDHDGMVASALRDLGGEIVDIS